MPKTPDHARLDRVVAEARRQADARAETYRGQALKLFPWVCGRCGRTFDSRNLAQLTVHHKDHNHDNTPPDGSNWELLCLYCHDAEHSRDLDAPLIAPTRASNQPATAASHNPFAGLKDLLGKGK
ncbi:MAG: YajD family HNH nuclease [Thiobacillaceae bacterium]|nr:YajD family HNH nuclease [Thiobacillaceae bacterium]